MRPAHSNGKEKKTSPFKRPGARKEARELMWRHRKKLAIGFVVMIINRLSGLVLPASSKYLIDDVIGRGEAGLLVPLALAVGAATIVQAVTTFSLSQIVSVTAQQAIMDMRRRVQERVTRHLPNLLLGQQFLTVQFTEACRPAPSRLSHRPPSKHTTSDAELIRTPHPPPGAPLGTVIRALRRTVLTRMAR
jgi:ABC-type multidrug transport system fused ATPase/permease subunit